MTSDSIALAVNYLVLAAFAASLVCWVRLLRERWLSRHASAPLVAPESRRAPFWSIVDVVLWIGLFILLSSLIQLSMVRLGWIETTGKAPVAGEPIADAPTPKPESISLPALAGQATASLLASALTVGLLYVKANGARLKANGARAIRELGFVWRPSDLRLGLTAALFILPPVMLVMLVVTQFVDYEHAVLARLQADPSPAVIATLCLLTVGVAPLTEEFAFRVLLQGSLQRLADHRSPGGEDRTPRSNWPVVVASVLFAAVHVGQGPAPIPLFFLSLGLGYLYRQTGRITPSLVVHMVLNGVTMAVTITQTVAKQPGG